MKTIKCPKCNGKKYIKTVCIAPAKSPSIKETRTGTQVVIFSDCFVCNALGKLDKKIIDSRIKSKVKK